MNDTTDVIVVNRCNQSDEFRTVLPANVCVRVLLILMLASAGAHNDAADVSGDDQRHAPRHSHDPAGGGSRIWNCKDMVE
ncbi:MAG: hypothetical protein C5S52_08200 [ANME-2 cluster archaeon]|nr:hypothetical protein [ANME-2 cluster archaeon]